MFYLFYGADEFSAREGLGIIKRGNDFGDYNITVLRGDQVSVNGIKDTCETIPFLSEKRLVIIEGLPKKRKAAGKGGESDDAGTTAPADKSAKFETELTAYAAQVPEYTILVLLAEEQLDNRSALVKAVKLLPDNKGKVVECPRLRADALGPWVEARVRALDGKISGRAAAKLARYVGNDLRVLSSEVDKLLAYVGHKGMITEKEIALLTPQAMQGTIFNLTDALGQRQTAHALKLLHQLVDEGAQAPYLLVMIGRHTGQLIQARELLDKNLGDGRIAQELGLESWRAGKVIGQARKFSMGQLQAIHRRLLEIDVNSKRGKGDPLLALDLLVQGMGGAPGR